MAQVQYIYQNSIEDLKKNTIYDYQNLENVEVTIYGNETTQELLNIQ
jgi:hypothetical protein